MFPMPRFPPRGPLGRLFPRFDGTIKALRLPAVPPAAFRFLRLAVPREHASFRSRRRCVRQRRAWGWSLGIPFRDFFRGDDRISQVPGEPQFPFAHVLRPRPADASLTIDGTLAWPPLPERRRRRRRKIFRGSIAWLSGSPPTYHALVSRQRARLASRCWSGSPGRAFTRRAPIKGFNSLHVRYPPFPRLSWLEQRNHNPRVRGSNPCAATEVMVWICSP